MIASNFGSRREDWKGAWLTLRRVFCASLTLTLVACVPTTGEHRAPTPPEETRPRKIVQIPPQYPIRAYDQKIQGRVLLRGTLAPSGYLTNLVVTYSQPANVFDEESLKAVAGWRYSIPKGWLESNPGFVLAIDVTYELYPSCGAIPELEGAEGRMERVTLCSYPRDMDPRNVPPPRKP